ncbi:MAG: choice-of-anchor D domain-containing protein [Myxococcaceae bacterium]
MGFAAGCFEPPPAPGCGPANCQGCCDPAGMCQSGVALQACGVAGLACSSCQAGQLCFAGQCTTPAPVDSDGGLDGGGDGGTDGGGGELGVVYPDGAGGTLVSRDAVYDFGAVFGGQQLPLKLVVKNLGNGALWLDRLDKDGGDAVTIGSTLAEPNPVFDVRFAQRTLAPAEVAQFDMTFKPAAQAQTVVVHQTTLVLRGPDGGTDLQTATITLKGRAVSPPCTVPASLDFGAVATGDTVKVTYQLLNPTPLELTATVGDPYSSSGDHLAFAFSAESVRGTVTLPPGTSRTVAVNFSPTALKSYLAFLKIRPAAQCPESVVSLTGQAVSQVLTWSPSPVDFGYVPPGVEHTRELTFANAGNADVSLSLIRTLMPTEFKVVAAPGQDPTLLTVPGKGTAKLVLSLKPVVLGPRTTQLTFSTSLVRQAAGSVPLRGYGGGPVIRVQPSPTLAFGKVAYFASASPPAFQTRKLNVANVGTAPAVADPAANLHLGVNNTLPYFSITALNAASSLSEISIAVPPVTGPNAYDPAQGLVASLPNNSVDLVVKVTPASIGLKEFEVTLFSNDLITPAVKVKVTADAQVVPSCNYQVTPAALNFGLVAPPSSRDLAFTVQNLGLSAGETCLLSGLDVVAGSSASFSIVGGAVASKELQPGESYPVTVRASPQGPVPVTPVNAAGSVQFFMSSPTVPQRSVSLQALIGASCLTIAPDRLDFGTVKSACYSATRTIKLYNSCSSSVSVTGITLQAPAEFSLVSIPALPSTLAAGGVPLTLSARYKPIDLGADQGAIAVNVTQLGQPVTYLISLQARGDLLGSNTEVIAFAAQPKADVLLVIDDSCSMGTHQVALGNNFASFIQYAVAAGVGYQLGVTTTDNEPGGPQGRLQGTPKLLTPTTPNVEALFTQKVNVGINGSGSEQCAAPALAALTAPLITSDNQGFLRPDASLGVLAITDAVDQSMLPWSFYLDALSTVRDANLFSYSVIGPFNPSPPITCAYDSVPDDGFHAFLTGATTGAKGEICTTDWAKSLEQLGKTAFGFRTNFFLKSTPDLTGGRTITVKINGVVLDPIDNRGTTVWTYDPVANLLHFEPMFVPEPGQTLSIEYLGFCL